MPEVNLDQLIADCKELRDALRKRHSDLSTVLSELYAEKAHFIYELLQNAEDAGATRMVLHLRPTALIVCHNGRAFTTHDIDAITGISKTDNEKKTDQDKIGRFGIGFKSVFKVTQRPRIQSGQFDFEIEDYIVPVMLAVDAACEETTITLPFTGGEDAVQSTYSAIEAKLQTLEAFNLLFLRNLKELRLQWGDEQYRLLTKRGQPNSDSSAPTIQTLSEETHSHPVAQLRYLVFQALVQHLDFQRLRTPQYVALAFRLADQEGPVRLVAAENDFAFVFFETAHKTSLNFLVHAPFVTTPSRENLKAELPVNNALMQELGTLLQQTLPYFKKHKMLTVSTLLLLPLARPQAEANRSPLYTILFNTLKESLASAEAFLPIIGERGHQPATRLLLAGSRELTSLLDARRQLDALWPGRSHWLPPGITAVATPSLYTYLRQELQVPEISASAAVQLFSTEFLAAQSAAWMGRFYSFLGTNRQATLWQKASGNSRTAGILRQQPFMRIRGNAYSPPFGIDDKPLVFLPLENGGEQRANCLDPATLITKPARSFVTQLGIKKPELLDEIRLHVLPRYARDVKAFPSQRQVKQHFKLLVAAYALGGERRRELLALVRDPALHLVRTLTPTTEKSGFCACEDAYLPDTLLASYLHYSADAPLVDTAFYQQSGAKQWRAILQEFGVRHDQPRLIEFDPQLSPEQARALQTSHTRWNTTTLDYTLEGLAELLAVRPFTSELSGLLWKILLRTTEQVNSRNALYGKHKWHYNKWHHTSFPSRLKRLLEDSPWMCMSTPAGEIQWQPLTEVVFEELPKLYDRSSEAALYLQQHFRWKTEAQVSLEQQMQPEVRAKWDAFKQADRDGIDVVAAIEAQRARQQPQREEEKRRLAEAPPLNPDNFTELPFEPINSADADVGERQKGDISAPDGHSAPAQKLGTTLRKGIGDRGEDVVWKQLQKQYNADTSLTCQERTASYVHYIRTADNTKLELIHGNTDTTTSEGCDLLIKQNGEIIRYIEIKSTIETAKAVFEVSERQWRVAATLCKNQQGERYELWVVRGVLTAKPSFTRITNPVERWGKGELGAAPVYLTL